MIERGKSQSKNRAMFRDAKGRWVLDYYALGKRRRKVAGRSKADADRMLRQLRSQLDSGEYVDPVGVPTFARFAEIFAERHGRHKVSYQKNAYVTKSLVEFFGTTKLSRITSGHVEDYRTARLGGERGKVTVNREIEVLRTMLAKAVKWGFLAKNPADKVEDYDEDNKRERFLSNDEVRRLLRATKKSRSPLLRPAVYLALETGMRKAELLGLRWDDVRFEAGKILVRETKSGEPRHVPMSRRST
jgi:integrase